MLPQILNIICFTNNYSEISHNLSQKKSAVLRKMRNNFEKINRNHMALAAELPPPVESSYRERIGPNDTPILFDNLSVEESLANPECLRLLRSGVASVVDFFCARASDLVRIALGTGDSAGAAYSVILSEQAAILNKILESGVLNQLAQGILDDEDFDRRVFVTFVSTARLCLTKAHARNISKVDFLAKLVKFADELCVCDLFLSLVSMRGDKWTANSLVLNSKVIEEIDVQIQKNKHAENFVRVLTYMSCSDVLKERMCHCGVLEHVIENMGERDETTRSCMWSYLAIMAMPKTYRVLQEVTGLAIEDVMNGKRFGLLESNALDFLVECCLLNTELAGRVVELGIIPAVIQRLSELPNSSSCMLHVFERCRALHGVWVMREAIEKACVEFACKALLERERNIPMAGVAWDILERSGFRAACMVNDAGVVQVVMHMRKIAEAEYGGPVPYRGIAFSRSCDLSPDEIISMFRAVMNKSE